MLEFKCANCKEIFTQSRTEEEALQEKKELFGNMPLNEMETVCHECFYKIMKYNNHPGF